MSGVGHIGFFQQEPATDIDPRRPEDAAELAGPIRREADAKQRGRLRAVGPALAGHPTLAVMAMLGRSRGFVQRWCYACRDGGLDAPAAEPPPGRPAKLPADRLPAPEQRVLAGPADEGGVCTLRGEDRRRILGRGLGTSYSPSGVYGLLHRLGLEVLAPRPQHRKSDPAATRQWEGRAPFFSGASGRGTPTRASPSGPGTRRGSGNKAP